MARAFTVTLCVLAPLLHISHGACADGACAADATAAVASLSLLQTKGAMNHQANLLEDEDEERLPPFRFRKHGITDMQYPISAAGSETLQSTNAVSVRRCDMSQVYEALDFLPEGSRCFPGVQEELYSTNVKFQATHPDEPGTDESFNFWTEFSEVVAAQLARVNHGKTKDIMSVHPLFDAEETIHESAQRVRADFPSDFPTEQLKRFFGQGLTYDTNIVNHPRCYPGNEFINRPVTLSAVVGWAVRTVSPACFMAKWWVGRARPEEVAREISQNSSRFGVGAALQGLVAPFFALGDTAFTAYAEGSPGHPSYPAMHSAASSMSTWLDVLANLTDAQRDEVRLLDYSVAYFRTLAGVHYESDNRAGLGLGQLIMFNKLPSYLGDLFGCDQASKADIAAYVTSKIARQRSDNPLDWGTWVPPVWNPPTLPAQQTQWVKGANGAVCDAVCGAIGKECNSAMQSSLTTNELVRDAFAQAGYICTSFQGARSYAGTPFAKGTDHDDCAPMEAGATSSCTANRRGHHSPLCACT